MAANMLNKPNTSRPYPAQNWRMPPLSTVWLCDDGCSRSLGEMIEGTGFVPKDDQDVLMLLEQHGCDWTSPIVAYSFMQRDEAIAALGDPNRYLGVSMRDAEFGGMRWTYDSLVNETISAFVVSHLPDAHGWEGGTYSATSLDGNDGQAYRIEADIPTSAQDCWVSFEIAIPAYGIEPMVPFFHAIRSGANRDEETTYVCEGLDGEWEESESEQLISSLMRGLLNHFAHTNGCLRRVGTHVVPL